MPPQLYLGKLKFTLAQVVCRFIVGLWCSHTRSKRSLLGCLDNIWGKLRENSHFHTHFSRAHHVKVVYIRVVYEPIKVGDHVRDFKWVMSNTVMEIGPLEEAKRVLQWLIPQMMTDRWLGGGSEFLSMSKSENCVGRDHNEYNFNYRLMWVNTFMWYWRDKLVHNSHYRCQF